MKDFKKRLLAFIMSIAIVCSLLPTSVFAAPVESVVITTEFLEDGVVLRSYTKALEAEGEGTITWEITEGALPIGLELDSQTGEISGAPLQAGEFIFTVTAKNESGDSDSKKFNMIVKSAFARIAGVVKDSNGNPIKDVIVKRLDKDGTLLETQQTDTDGKYIFSGNFPYGIYQIKASLDEYHDSTIDVILHGQDILDADITINSTSSTITTESLENGVVLRSYTQTLKSVGGSDVTWAITEGSLPNGLKLDSETGEISGVPLQTGEYTFTVTAKNKSGETDSKEFTVNVSYAFARVAGVVKDSNGNPLEGAIVTLLDNNGNTFGSISTDEEGKYIISGNFPYGSYQITANLDEYHDSTIDVILHGQDILDADITVNSTSATITTESLENGVVLRSYTQTLKSVGGSDVTWAITEGSLPNVLKLDSETGEISGVPLQTGEYTFTVTATNKSGETDSKEFTVNVSYAFARVAGVVKDSSGIPIANATVIRYDRQGTLLETTKTDKDGKYIFSGNFPYDFPYGYYQIKASCDGYNDGIAIITLTGGDLIDTNITLADKVDVVPDGKPINIITETLEDGVALRSYTKYLEVEGGEIVTWSVTNGSLPKGLYLNIMTGQISGTPIQVGEYTFTVTATDESGTTDSQEFTMNVGYAYIQISGYVKDSDGNPIEGAKVTFLNKDKTSVEVYTNEDGKYIISGNFQYGKNFIEVSKEGYSETEVEFLVTNSAYQYPDDIILNKKSSLYITTESLEDGVVLRSYTKALEAEGEGTITWEITKGDLPSGLKLDSATGVISGAPLQAGEFIFTVTATNESGETASKEFTMNVGYAYIQISGYVKDSDGNPVEGAKVTFFNKDKTSVEKYTNEEGKYIISGNFQYGKHFIEVSKEGYLDTEIEFLVTNSAYQYPDDIILSATIPNTYEIIEGAGSVWQKGNLEGLKFVSNGEYDKFTGVMVDDQAISTDYYTSEEGSTVITLNASYLETLSLGEHELTINYQDGSAKTTFTINEASSTPNEPSQNQNNSQNEVSQNETSQNNKDTSVQATGNPKTGDNSFVEFMIGLIGLSIAWVTANMFVRKRRSSK